MNGVVTRKINLAECPLCLFEHWVGGDCPPQHPKLQPYHLRINSSRGLDHAKYYPKGKELPQELLVDYVRVYKKTNTKAIEIGSSCYENNLWTPTRSLSQNGNRTLYLGATYYPNIRYEWKSKDFAIQNPNERVATIQIPPQKLPKGTYPIYFTATYPSGNIETDSLLITID